jgi:type I restriction enzyme S subunit
MRKYDSYKDSGVEWIGEIPSHWKAVPMRFLLRQRITDGPHETPKFLSEGIPFLSVDGIQDGELVFEGCRKISEEDHEKYKQKCVVEKHDILMGKAASVGKVAQVKVDFEFSIWSPLALLKPNHEKITSSYFEYFLKSTYAKDNANILSTFNTQQNISMTDIPRIFFIIPNSVEEQTAIANYLDRKTAKIDELIADKKRLLELYEEEKTTIINQAVTKGINPDIPMKDSGIEWLGEIPEHWVVKRLKHVSTKIGDGIHTTPSYLQGTEIYFINGVNLNNGEITLTDKTLSVPIEEYDKFKIDLKLGSILVSLNGTIGKLAFYNDEKVILGKSAAYIEIKDLVFNKFIYFVLKSQYINNYFEDSFSGTTIKNLSLYTLRNTPFPYMTVVEQKSIVQHIETECARIDAKKSKTEKLIELLTEYRTALISEVVTGKIKVIE